MDMTAHRPLSLRIQTEAPRALPLPEKLEGLRDLAYNVYWTWHPRAQDLFRRIDRQVWSATRSPVSVLQARLDFSELLDTPEFMAEYHSVLDEFDAYMENTTKHWWGRRYRGEDQKPPIAYFCAEYGLHESIQLYSGGLGVLAGDHLKAASDMGLPLVAVGLFYRQGYFRQSIDADGHQEHHYPRLDPHDLPLLRVLDPRSGRPLMVSIPFEGRHVHAAVWQCRVGRVPLLLLDTDIAENEEADRPITAQLYVRGRDMRLYQEIVLGVGGVRVLDALSVKPGVFHLNEGHSAFLLIERVHQLTKQGVSFDEAKERIKAHSVFTIHTPVPAGNERYDAGLTRKLISPLLHEANIDVDAVLGLGLGVDDDRGIFDMTAFGLRLSRHANAVSQLHAATANETWKDSVGFEIDGVTNGVHMPSWLGGPLRALYESHGTNLDDFGPNDHSSRLWEHMEQLSDTALWHSHQRQKLELAYFVRKRLRRQLSRHGESPEELRALDEVLGPDVLTIGFARRFATYKRAALLFSNEERLARLMEAAGRPVQFLFAGKAHPADRPGQKVIQDIFQKSRQGPFKGRFFILEDYDIRIGRHMVQGVDVWLNNPRRPLEASGTSGMKAAANGVPNASVLDGWWDEGFDNDNGWAIGTREQADSEAEQDQADADSLYRILENEIVPLYYGRGDDGLPHGWIKRMRLSIAKSLWQFSTTRMLTEYVDRMYLPK
jgi:glycogen phosphorylase